jgi:alkylation response protein AidB-like acyl-CoA dehydrogenase
MITQARATEDFAAHEIEIIDTVRRFISRDVRPHVSRLEREAVYPNALVAQMKELGIFGCNVPEIYGGLGLRLPVFARVIEELAKGWTTLAAYVNSHSTVAYLLDKYGTPEQQRRYLPRMATSETRGALCLTESAAGSDLRAIETTATAVGVDFTLRGNKVFVTNGGRASLLLTLVKLDARAEGPKQGMSLMLVEKETPGVSMTGAMQKMAYGLVDTVEIRLDNARVPKAALLGGEPGLGLSQLLDGLELGRIAIAASAVGLAASALAEAKRYAGERKAFGVTIDRHQAVQLRLADMATKLVAARLLTAEAAREKGRGNRADMLSAMAKLFASEACAAIASDALRIHGGYGYMNEFAVERLYREAPLYLVGEGTNDIQKLVIARRLLEGAEASALDLPL